MTDFAETLRKHWRNARESARSHLDGRHGCSDCMVFADRVLVLEALAKECGIELEPKKCVLCDHGGALCCIAGLPSSVVMCIDRDACRHRLGLRYLEQLKDGAR